MYKIELQVEYSDKSELETVVNDARDGAVAALSASDEMDGPGPAAHGVTDTAVRWSVTPGDWAGHCTTCKQDIYGDVEDFPACPVCGDQSGMVPF